MLLGRVIGTVVPNTLADELSATPMLWIQPLDKDGEKDVGEPVVCADGTRMAGPGHGRAAACAGTRFSRRDSVEIASSMRPRRCSVRPASAAGMCSRGCCCVAASKCVSAAR